MFSALRLNMLFWIFASLMWGCGDPCLDLDELDELSAMTREWFVHDSIGNTIITDQYGISQTLRLHRDPMSETEIQVQDDCGNHYGSFYYTIQYNTSMSNIHFLVGIAGSALGEDRFSLNLLTTNTAQAEEHKRILVNLETMSCPEEKGTVDLLEQLTVNGRSYDNVLEITHKQVFSEKDPVKVYYASGYGIIRYVDKAGNDYGVN